MASGNDTVVVEGIKASNGTDDAVHFIQNNKEFWIPRSQCDSISTGPRNDAGVQKMTIKCLRWIAEKKCLFYDEED